MKRIILSSVILVAAAALVVGATTAFFNDTETSTGNVFTAGSIDLTVDSFGATYNGEDVTGDNSTWTARDLTDEKFFVFEDLKPGDYGTRHISVHVDDNPSYACLLVVNKVDGENGIVDPEETAGDESEETGELSANISLFAWQDNDPNNIFEPDEGEVPLPLNGDSNFVVDSFFDVFYDIDISDSGSGTDTLVPTGPASTRNIAIAWCAGEQSVNLDTGVITCDGSAMGDRSQTDSFSADVVLYAEQVRNNPDFLCSEVELEEELPS